MPNAARFARRATRIPPCPGPQHRDRCFPSTAFNGSRAACDVDEHQRNLGVRCTLATALHESYTGGNVRHIVLERRVCDRPTV